MTNAMSTAGPVAPVCGGDDRRSRTILLPVDAAHPGSAAVGRLEPWLAGHRLIVVGTWRKIGETAAMAHAALPASFAALGATRLDEENRAAAWAVAADAVSVARECGIEACAEMLVLRGNWAPCIAALAADRRADAVLLTRPARGLERRLRRLHPAPLILRPA